MRARVTGWFLGRVEPSCGHWLRDICDAWGQETSGRNSPLASKADVTLDPNLPPRDRAMHCLRNQGDVPWADSKARNCVSRLRVHRYLCDTGVVLMSLIIDSSLRPRIVCSAVGVLWQLWIWRWAPWHSPMVSFTACSPVHVVLCPDLLPDVGRSISETLSSDQCRSKCRFNGHWPGDPGTLPSVEFLCSWLYCLKVESMPLCCLQHKGERWNSLFYLLQYGFHLALIRAATEVLHLCP